ncbi:MAG: DUF503 domain-containing protein [Clostridiales bacterium]|nr:DUF503 domain-containing protein [Clostridiales bacterium]
MVIGCCMIKIRTEWVNSLKDKRMELRRIVDRSKNKFNISIAEIGSNDNHKIIELGFACVTNDRALADSIIDNVINFIERITDGEIIETETEIL